MRSVLPSSPRFKIVFVISCWRVVVEDDVVGVSFFDSSKRIIRERDLEKLYKRIERIRRESVTAMEVSMAKEPRRLVEGRFRSRRLWSAE